MSELKPCPFCGKEPAIHANFAICVNDDCEQSDYWTGLEVDTWNTRPIEDALNARIAELEAVIDKLIEAGRPLRDYAILVSFDHPMGDGQMALNDKSAWDALVTEWQKERETC